MTRVKICGITCVDDALAAVDAGADAIGCIFYPPSQSNVSLAAACEIVRALPPFVCALAVVVDPTDEALAAIVAEGCFSAIQFHGDEDAARCARSPLPYLKAVAVDRAGDIERAAAEHRAAQGLLLDTFKIGFRGGTGETFDWSLVPEGLATRIVLSGGLTADNVRAAIERLRPYAVDVKSGVEARPGRKDPVKLRAFVREVERAAAT
jgi:phosphoribosylanthranilate isomerase